MHPKFYQSEVRTRDLSDHEQRILCLWDVAITTDPSGAPKYNFDRSLCTQSSSWPGFSHSHHDILSVRQ